MIFRQNASLLFLAGEKTEGRESQGADQKNSRRQGEKQGGKCTPKMSGVKQVEGEYSGVSDQKANQAFHVRSTREMGRSGPRAKFAGLRFKVALKGKEKKNQGALAAFGGGAGPSLRESSLGRERSLTRRLLRIGGNSWSGYEGGKRELSNVEALDWGKKQKGKSSGRAWRKGSKIFSRSHHIHGRS